MKSQATSNSYPVKPGANKTKSYNVKLLIVAVTAFAALELCGTHVTPSAYPVTQGISEVLTCVFLGGLIMLWKVFGKKPKNLPQTEAPILDSQTNQFSPREPPIASKVMTAPPGLEDEVELHGANQPARDQASTKAPWRRAPDSLEPIKAEKPVQKGLAPWRKAQKTESSDTSGSEQSDSTPGRNWNDVRRPSVCQERDWTDVRSKKSSHVHKRDRTDVQGVQPKKSDGVPSSLKDLTPLLATWICYHTQGLKQEHKIFMQSGKLKCNTLTEQRDGSAVKTFYNLVVKDDNSVFWGNSGKIKLDATQIAQGKITWLNQGGSSWKWTLSKEQAHEMM